MCVRMHINNIDLKELTVQYRLETLILTGVNSSWHSQIFVESIGA